MTINLGEINWLAVAVAALATFMLGGVWYTALFGKAWQKAHHIDETKMTEMQKARPMPVFLAWQMVCYIIISFGMAVIITGTGIASLSEGATLGACIWVVVAAVVLTNHLPTPTEWTGYFIDVSYQAIYCVGTGALLGAWQ
jgi:hypothetical protein